MDESQVQNAAAPAKKKGGLLKTLILVTFLLMSAGAGATWWFMGDSASAAPEEPELSTRGLISFEPFLVNLTDAGGSRFLKANVALVLPSDAQAKHVAESPVVLGHLRSAILEILAEQSAPALVTPEGKDALKQAIKTGTAQYLKQEKVMDVLFSEFVVQF